MKVSNNRPAVNPNKAQQPKKAAQAPKAPQSKPTTATIASYKQKLATMSATDLANLEAYAKTKLADVTSGAEQNPGAADRIRAKLALIGQEKAARAAIEKSADPAFAQLVHTGTEQQLKTEVTRQKERLKEATTGAAKDPAVAKDARQKLAALEGELKTRETDKAAGRFAADTATKAGTVKDVRGFQDLLGTKTDEELGTMKDQLLERISDAESGHHKDPIAANNAKIQLAELTREMAYREQLAKSSDPAYATDLHAMSDSQLKTESAALKEQIKDATTGFFTDQTAAAEARKKLALVNSELSFRKINDALAVLEVNPRKAIMSDGFEAAPPQRRYF